MRWKLSAQTKPLIHLRHAKSFLSRAACKVPHCQKWDCHALPLFALDRAIPRLFSISILIAGETKNGRAKSTRWSVWQPCFWGCDMTLRTPPAASKVHQNNETTKAKKDDTNIHVLNCCVESFLLKQNLWSTCVMRRASCLEQLARFPIPFLAVWNLASCSRQEALRMTQVDQRFCLSRKLSTQQFSTWMFVSSFLAFRIMRPQKPKRMTQTSMCWTVALKAFCSNKTFDPLASCEELLVSSSLQGSTLPKMGLPRATAFRFGQGHSEAVFNFYFNSRRDQKRARQIYTLERVAALFLGLRHDAQNASSCFKSSPE